jgi:hypothetical protein
MLNNELERVKESNSNLQVNTTDVESNLKVLERKLKEKEWELKDTIAIKDAKYESNNFKQQQKNT